MSHYTMPLTHPDLPEHDCCYATTEPDGASYLCGQLCGHKGDCTWWAPGQFPFPPILHPLDLWLAERRMRIGLSGCPNGHKLQARWHVSSIHGGRWLPIDQSISLEPPQDVIQDQYGEIWRPDYDAEIEFRPCGCRYRLT
jgi:hypothetical protein